MSLWMVRGGKYGEQENISFDNNIACIGFQEVPDLSKATSKEEIFELVRETYPDEKIMAIRNFTGQLRTFAHRMKEGDLVAMPLRNRSNVAIGRVTGPYQYRTDLGDFHHTRKVEWLKTDIPRTAFGQDLLYSLGAIMTVCRIKRNNAEERFKAILAGKSDPGPALASGPLAGKAPPGGGELRAGEGKEGTEMDMGPEDDEENVFTDVEQFARDQILGHLVKNFKGHDLARLVDYVLKAEGYVTNLSPPGPDGGVDILAGSGSLGLDNPRICVQVKSTQSPSDVTVFRGLQGSMTTFQADQGLLVSWGGFTNAVIQEARLNYFKVKLWDSGDLVKAILKNYDRFPEELQKELPLKRIWALVPEE